MTKIFHKCIQTLVSTHPKNRLLHPFLKTATICISFSDKNIKYWKINRKNTELRLKTFINNIFS